MTQASDNVQAALAWAAAGCSVIPIRADGTKKPLIDWKPYQFKRADEAQIRRWFTGREYGIGIVCGAISGNLELCELEARATNGESFDKIQEAADVEFDNWDKWVLGHRTYAEHTPSGGIHLLYRLADGVVPGNTKLANNGANECLAETRGEGGYVIVAPTGGKVHATGEDWKAINGCLPAGIQTIPFSLRNELHGVLKKALDERPARDVRAAVSKPTPVIESALHLETPGDHFERVTPWGDILEPHGWVYHHHDGNEDFWTRPGKDPHLGHSATTGYANDRDRMYVFSSSAGLPIEEPLTKFAVYTELNFGRERFDLAAADLRRQGFGTDRPLVHEPEDWSDFGLEPEQVKRPEKPVEATDSTEPSPRKLRVRKLSTFTMMRTKWIWEGRIPLGEITLLGGREGTGKSSILAKWAAEITTGTMPGEFFGIPRNLIYVAAEDSFEKTILPRMVAAGADIDRITIMDLDPECGQYGSPEFPVDCKELERIIREEDAVMVMFDPLLSNISSKVNVNQSKELRTALEPLRKVAERTECAIIGLAHLNKTTGSDVSSKFVGSRAFLEVARAVFSVGKAPKEQVDEEDEFFADQTPEYILDQEKNNLGPNNYPGITYKIVTADMEAPNGDQVSTNMVVFTGETTVKVEDILNGSAKSQGETLQAKVVAFVKKHFAKANLLVQAAQIVEALGGSQGAIRSALSRAVNDGLLACPQRGLYGPPGATGGGQVSPSRSG